MSKQIPPPVDVAPGGLAPLPARWLRERKRFHRQIEEALAAEELPRINVSGESHLVSAAVVREFVYDPRFAGRAIQTRYQDGSLGGNFPIGCLDGSASVTSGNGLPLLRLGLMSFRHPELDYLVDLYVNRNLEIAQELSMSQEEAVSYGRAVDYLSDPAVHRGATLEIYHTGLEPMVIGFYRAVVTVLRERAQRGLPRTLIVQPKLFHGKPTTSGLSPSSPGAKPENYLSDSCWW